MGFNGVRWAKKPPGPTARARKKKRAKLVKYESSEKAKVRARDKVCRFPLCGCKQGTTPVNGHDWLTVSHHVHKGMGGDPTGGVSIAPLMVLLCVWRHQEAPVSRHAGTIRTRYLTPDHYDGPVAWDVNLSALRPGMYDRREMWIEVAREDYAGDSIDDGFVLCELTDEQQAVLDELAEMRR